MSAPEVYHQVKELLRTHIEAGKVDDSTVNRLALLVMGIIHGKSASPARIASALRTLGLSQAHTDSIERQIRRLENDPEVSAALCFHPFARVRLQFGRPKTLYLILDVTTQEDRLVMLSVSVWYRGRALPLVWMVWPGNTPLEGEGFWKRVETLLEQVKGLLPANTEIIWLADRAFGTPVFLDMLRRAGWHYVVRVQGQTRYQDQRGREGAVQDLLQKGKRAKMRGRVFKKAGWRSNSVVVYWSKAYQSPLCLVSDLPPDWSLLALYRRRYPIEASFRDYKSYGWRWEQGQVKEQEHLERLLVGMALAAWIVLFIGTQAAGEILERYRSAHRYTRPYEAKRSLFALGLEWLGVWLCAETVPRLTWELCGWTAPNWEDQLYFFIARQYVFA